jgi:drug/metabolite transporter (DMT)-like permease
MAVLLALLSGVLWGSSDFLGGLLSKRRAAYAVVGASQAAGLVAATIAAIVTDGFSSPLGWVVPSLLAGVAGAVALIAFYAAMATGTMGVVAPIAALGALVPIAGGLLAGERLTALTSVGMALALLGGVVASGPEFNSRAGPRPYLLAAVAATSFGLVMLFIARGAQTDPVMTVWGMRLTIASGIGVVALVTRRTGGLHPGDVGPLIVLGTGAASANLFYGLASQLGQVSVSSALAALSPVVTVVLAWLVLRERLLRIQYVAVAVALAGVTLLSVG